MLPAKPNENFSRLADASTQVEENLQALAQQAMTENLTPQKKEAIEAVSQGESMQQMMQNQLPADKAAELLRRFKEVASQQGLSSQNIEWVSEQIHRWKSHKQRQQFLEDTLERGKNSSTPQRNLFYKETREVQLLERLDGKVTAYFEEIQHAEANDEYVSNVTHSAHKMDKALAEMEFLQKRLAPDLENKKELVKDAEAERRDDLQKAMKLTMKRVGELAALQALQPDLQPYHKHALIALRRQQDELQRLQAPWPEAQPGVGTAVEAQPRASTETKARPGPSLER